MKLSNILKGCAILLCTVTGSTFAQKIPNSILDKIEYRELGPTRQSGRFVDFAVVEQTPKVYYAATASGGLLKTVNNGISFEQIFDNESVISIGDVAVAPSDPNIVWVGTGEANNSRSSYWGDGVYKSTDAGQTWTNMGLKESQHVGRIIIHPTNPDIVYVAALGHLYSDNEERGVYKSTDGGKSWTKSLDIVVNNKNIGVVDLAIRPDNPNVLFAASFDKIRTPWTYNPGGPGSGIYVSIDAGASWAKLAGGLPGGFLGRIGFDISQSNPDVMYANIENVNVEGMKEKDRLKQLMEGIPLEKGKKVAGDEMWRSDDGGNTWRKVSKDGVSVGGGPAYYYQQVRIDPTDTEHVYVIGQRMWETKDGGKTWERPFSFGGDNHAMWINKNDIDHMLLGYDHGMGVTYDAGKTWYHPDEQSLAQFYAVGYDMDYPYNVYGGIQDNGSAKGPSTKRNGQPIRLEDWTRVGGGDGMYNVVDPNDSRWLYNESQMGPLRRVDQLTGDSKSIAYRNINRDMRWNWNSPILISPHNSDVIYHAGNKLVKSTFRGETWEEVSPDLSTNNAAKIQGTGNIAYCTIVSIDESPMQEGILWVGTDDGNVQLSKDGGKNWSLLNANIIGNPGYWVSRVTASSHSVGTAYISYTGYRRDDFRPFLYKTTDFGASWSSIANNLPNEPINVIREDHKNPELLFVGTDMGVYISIDGGNGWNKMKGDMPTVPVHDLKIHPRENDLIVATHGRGIYITDITALQELNAGVINGSAHVFKIEPRVNWVEGMQKNSASTNFNGEIENTNIVINYYSKSDADSVTFQVYSGPRLVSEVKAAVQAGLNQTVWSKSVRSRLRTDKEKQDLQRRFQRFANFMSKDQLLNYKASFDMDYMTESAPEGTYEVRATIGGKEYSRNAVILKDHWYK